MPTFLVTWDIHIEADTPKEAARRALEIQRDLNSTATAFIVKEVSLEKDGPEITIDLWE